MEYLKELKDTFNGIKTSIKNLKYRRSPKCLVLLYHRVCEINEDPYSLIVTPNNFEEQMKYLKDNFNIISLSSLISQYKKRRLVNNSIVITFDDGYYDNLYYAKPILKKHGVPATLFITPGPSERNEEFWWDQLSQLFFSNAPKFGNKLELEIRRNLHQWNISNYCDLKSVFFEIHNILRYLSEAERNIVLEKLEELGNTRRKLRDDYRTLTQDELKQLAEEEIFEIGAHTMTHPSLPFEPSETQKNQIVRSKEILENIIEKSVKHFAYPFGTPRDINEKIISLTKKAGFQSACSLERGLVHSKSDIFRIPRNPILNWDLNKFNEALTEILSKQDIFNFIRKPFAYLSAGITANLYFRENLVPRIKKFKACDKGGQQINRILQINDNDTYGGSARVCMSLHRRFKELGYNAKMLAKHSYSNDDDVIILVESSEEIQKNLYQYQRKQGMINLFNLSSFRIKNLAVFKSADIINLHNTLGNYFNLITLPEISSLKPIVWTLHDMHAFTGHCIHSFNCDKWQRGCGDCPYPSVFPPIEKDNTNLVWNYKKDIYENSNLTIVCPSKWLKNKVEKGILRKTDTKLIYNGIDESVFYPREKKKMREFLRLPLNKKIITFCAFLGASNFFKGGQYVNKLYDHYKNRDILFLVIGGEQGNNKHNWINISHVDQKELMAAFYSASDLVICPSIADNCPLVVLESLACGTPVIAFKTGGIPELIEHKKTGYLAKYRDIEDFINGIELFLYDDTTFKEAQILAVQKFKEKFSLSLMTNEYLKLYEEVMKKKEL